MSSSVPVSVRVLLSTSMAKCAISLQLMNSCTQVKVREDEVCPSCDAVSTEKR